MKLLIPIAFLFGVLIGSFLNVVVWRVPRGESVVSPPSACPECGELIAKRDNIPIVSWVLLRGRCRHCAGRISMRYPLVELVTGLVFVGITWHFAVLPVDLPDIFLLLALLYFGAVAVALTLIDLDHHRLPDPIVLPSIVVAAILLALSAAASGEWNALIRALLGGLVLFLVYFVMLVIYPQGMGFGDVKLAAFLGIYLAWFGWGALFVGAFLGFILGGIYALALLVTRRAHRKSGIPFGPWMILGTVIGILWGQSLWESYLGMFG